MKNLFAALLIIGTVATSSSVSAAGVSFADVQGTPFETSAVALAQAGVVSGYSDGTLRPYYYVRRAEAIKMIVEANPAFKRELNWFAAHPSPIPLFSDLAPTAWYTPYVEVAFKHHIITGYSDGTFRPDDIVSAGESISMIIRAMGSDNAPGSVVYSAAIDNQPGKWFTPYVNVAINKNLLMRGQTLSVAQNINRGQFFDILYRMREVSLKRLVAFNGPEPLNSSASGLQTGTQLAMQSPNVAGPQMIPVHPDNAKYLSKKAFAITIPSLGITDLSIATPKDPYTAKGVLVPLASGVGHLFNYPGQNGKILVYGHSSSNPWDKSSYTKIFRQINKLKNGDLVYVTYNGRLFTYKITGHKTVSAKDTKDYQPDGSGEQLILYTCWPPDSISQRFLQFATLVN
ncbi:MAG: sortase [Candidatus Peribacteraceae bacterium]|nr:sortase [Candidatus Peribacteraceae bacterium]